MEVQRHSSETFKKSVHYRTVVAWNDLPKDYQFPVQSEGDISSAKFKQHVFDNIVARRISSACE